MTDSDWTDRHVARWRTHWVDIRFDDEVEAVVTRISRLQKYLKGTIQRAVSEVGLQDYEYETLHSLMIRDTPGTASPTDLADDLGVSGAGMTGRLDGLEKGGWVQRTQSPDDRRRVVVEITRSGADVWRRAMALRGSQEEELVAVLSDRERAQLGKLLKKLTLWAEANDELQRLDHEQCDGRGQPPARLGRPHRPGPAAAPDAVPAPDRRAVR